MDFALMQRVAEGDQSGLAELYDRHASLLFGLILRVLGDRGEAEDVLQDVFVRVWQRADTFNPMFGTPIAWLVRIARNRAIDRLRARRPVVSDDAVADMASPDPDPHESAALTEQQLLVAAALKRLSPDERVLIEHAFLRGRTHVELATAFNMPLGTVKTRIRRGMLALRDALHDVRSGTMPASVRAIEHHE
jgi:RNA polymerase sigma-70 factor, ECF subfamily